jgi:hypothetical protein
LNRWGERGKSTAEARLHDDISPNPCEDKDERETELLRKGSKRIIPLVAGVYA